MFGWRLALCKHSANTVKSRSGAGFRKVWKSLRCATQISARSRPSKRPRFVMLPTKLRKSQRGKSSCCPRGSDFKGGLPSGGDTSVPPRMQFKRTPPLVSMPPTCAQACCAHMSMVIGGSCTEEPLMTIVYTMIAPSIPRVWS